METRMHIDTERLLTLAASFKLWLLEVTVWLAEWLGHALPRDMRMELRGDVRRALAGARMLVVMLALARVMRDVLPPEVKRALRPPSAPHGFQRRCGMRHDVRGLRRAVRLRGRSLAVRLACVREIFDTLDAWIARMVARLRRAPREAHLVLCFMLADALHVLHAQAPALADSS